MKLTKLEFKTELKLSAEFIRKNRHSFRSIQSATSKLQAMSPQAGDVLTQVRQGYRDADAASHLWGSVSYSVRYCGLVYGLHRGRTLEQMESSCKSERSESTLESYETLWSRLEALEASGDLAKWQAWYQSWSQSGDQTLDQRFAIMKLKNHFLQYGLPQVAPAQDEGTLTLSWEIPGCQVLCEVNPAGQCYVFMRERSTETFVHDDDFYDEVKSTPWTQVKGAVDYWNSEFNRSQRRLTKSRRLEREAREAAIEAKRQEKLAKPSWFGCVAKLFKGSV